MTSPSPRNSVLTRSLLALAPLSVLATALSAGIIYDANVTPDVIFGSGNANGGFTSVQENGVEVALRAKLRHNASGLPENTFNSNGDGSYTFNPGVAPTQLFPTAEWSFEWSINSNFDGTSGWVLSNLDYLLTLVDNTGNATSISFDPINVSFADHAIGNNLTGNGGGTVAATPSNYQTLIVTNNVAQNSWKPHWFLAGFNPDAAGTYDITLSAYGKTGLVASTMISIQVIPEPSVAIAGFTALSMGLLLLRRRR
jgi:hypothetical protein